MEDAGSPRDGGGGVTVPRYLTRVGSYDVVYQPRPPEKRPVPYGQLTFPRGPEPGNGPGGANGPGGSH